MTHLACGWQRELNRKITSVIFTPLHNPSAYCWPSTIHIISAKISRVFSKVHVKALTVTLWFLLFNSTFFLIILLYPSISVLFLILQLQKLGSLLEMSFDDRFQPESKYNLETFPSVTHSLRIKHLEGVLARKKNRCHTKTNMVEG